MVGIGAVGSSQVEVLKNHGREFLTLSGGGARSFGAEVLEAQAYLPPKTYFNRLYADTFRVSSRNVHKLSTGRGGRSPDFRCG